MSHMDQSDDSYRAVVPEGTHLAWSRDTEGAKRALLFEDGTNKLIGPPELIQADDEYEYEYEYEHEHEDSAYEAEVKPMTPEELEVALQGVLILATVLFRVVELAVIAVDTKIAPRFNIWWAQKARPRLKKLWDRRHRDVKPTAEENSSEERTHQTVAFELVDSRKASPEDFSKEMEVAFEKYKRGMSGAEARERRLAISLAEAFIAEQQRRLSDARIEDYDYFLELNRTMTQLEAQRVPDSINLMLESGVSDRGSGTLSELSRMHKDGHINQRTDLPLEVQVASRDFLLTKDGTQYSSRPINPEELSGHAT